MRRIGHVDAPDDLAHGRAMLDRRRQAEIVHGAERHLGAVRGAEDVALGDEAPVVEESPRQRKIIDAIDDALQSQNAHGGFLRL
jgi:hypothetical protein